ncbi:hypothetical protein OROMI_003827 [Orobanche minor]
MDVEEEKWVKLPKYSDKYRNGVTEFVRKAFFKYAVGNEFTCPCKICSNRFWSESKTIHEHLICNGPCKESVEWIYEVSNLRIDNFVDEMEVDDIGMGLGNEFEDMIRNAYGTKNERSEPGLRKGLNDDARKFYRLVKEGGQALYPECKKFTRLSFIVRLYQLKCIHGFSESAFSDLLELIKEVIPNVNLPSSFNVAKGMIKDLGLDYQKIHACPNDCMLFWAENERLDKCRKCGTSRWKLIEDKNTSDHTLNLSEKHRIPAKVMRYFPLKPRLQRMFLSSEFSNLMTWHALARKKDEKLRHPADGQGWKSMNAKYPDFATEIRNVRLGLAADGFNPYCSMNSTHSTWPVVLVNYNLPPWLIMKSENLILSTLIPGPNYPGNEIDVYMQPLVAELKELWAYGVETYDAKCDSTFKLQASLLWTISDFPGYALLSGWSTKGKLACPSCHYETSSIYLKHSKKVVYLNHRKFLPPDHKWRSDKRKFNGQVEMNGCPEMLTGEQVEELLYGYENNFGKQQTKQKGSSLDCPWKKKSIFFELPYWSSNMVRHNLDVMHIEKNIFDKILGTLLDIGGKTKDHLNARLDLEEMGIRKILHPIKCDDNKHVEIRAASFDMTKKEKEIFCSVLKNAKLPYGSASNISRCIHVKERKIFGYKSHDAHIILHYMLQFAVVKTLKPEVAIPLMRLGAFFRGICGKVIELDDVEKLQAEIIEILCELEMIFPPAFFDIMVHLPIHLCKEVEFGGPVHLRWMFGIERYLCKLKSYVRNRSKLEGCIAEGYLVEECLTFCSRFLRSRVTRVLILRIVTRMLVILSDVGKTKMGNLYIWKRKYGRKLIGTYYSIARTWKSRREHHTLVEKDAKAKKFKRERMHTAEFHKWLKEAVQNKDDISFELSCLAKGPHRAAKRFSGYVVNGYRFHTKSRDDRCTTQNSGVFLTALTTSFASSKDQNPIIGDVGYYGAIEDIIEVDYWGALNVVLFKCCWYQIDKDCYGLPRVNFNRLYQKDDPFVLATQVQQVFYIEDPTEKNLCFAVKKFPRDQYSEVEDLMNKVEDVCDIGSVSRRNIPFDDTVNWCREDIPMTQIFVSDDEQDNAEI